MDSVSIIPLGASLGAEVVGVDLSRPPDGPLQAVLNQALLEHVVLVLREQRFTPASYLEAAAAFGTPMRHSYRRMDMAGFPEIGVISSRKAELDQNGKALLFGADSWHADHLNLTRPPKATVLYAVALPSTGGDTCFADARAAYDRLPPPRRRVLDGLMTVNGFDRHLPPGNVAAADFETPAIHPLVRTHPETGRKAIYCHPLKLAHLSSRDSGEAWDGEASWAFIDDLIAEALDDEIIYRHQWRLGDMLICDNRACLHRAQRDYDTAEDRVVHRIILAGDRPV